MQYPPVDDKQYTTGRGEWPSLTSVIPTANAEDQDALRVHGSTHRACQADMESVTAIRVLLVDDHTLIREGLRQLLDLEENIQVAGEAGDGSEALQKVRQLQPDVVLMDIHMPVVDGIAVTRCLIRENPSIAVIMLTMYHQNQQILQAIKSGARGYLGKNVSIREVVRAIRTVHEGGMYIEPGLTRTIVNEFRRLSNASGEQQTALLQEKELEIIRYLAAGMSNKEIAEKLSYSEKTVKNYLSVIFQKLHLRDRTQVAIYALRQGLLLEEK